MNQASEHQSVVIAPFWRGPVSIEPDHFTELQEIYRAEASIKQVNRLAHLLPELSGVTRDNIRRILVAALVAKHNNVPVSLVEGCRTNRVASRGPDNQVLERHLTGSEVGMLIGRLLRKTEVISPDIPFRHVNESRCTDWEGDALLQQHPEATQFIGIAGRYSEPSSTRAAGIVSRLAREGIETNVYHPQQALDVFEITLTKNQQYLFNKSDGTNEEIDRDMYTEDRVSRLQGISDAIGGVLGMRGKNSPLAWVASALPSRRNRPYRK